ncbi:unnamed protein product [Acanthosepion pharaonis]|uniref:Uncharacterized protein n=1 Tax=Acanthosepion pharaonis TaxID=158019 RepID=A0A812BCI6_ACAPH|nr:unnamed protein product [Sepia pharaonis]
MLRLTVKSSTVPPFPGRNNSSLSPSSAKLLSFLPLFRSLSCSMNNRPGSLTALRAADLALATLSLSYLCPGVSAVLRAADLIPSSEAYPVSDLLQPSFLSAYSLSSLYSDVSTALCKEFYALWVCRYVSVSVPVSFIALLGEPLVFSFFLVDKSLV